MRCRRASSVSLPRVVGADEGPSDRAEGPAEGPAGVEEDAADEVFDVAGGLRREKVTERVLDAAVAEHLAHEPRRNAVVSGALELADATISPTPRPRDDVACGARGA